MPSFLLRPKVALFAAALVIPVVANGACGSRTACIAFTQAEFAANGNSCLAPSDALASFTSASCPGSIVSVDGAGTFDGEICCYPVTYDSIDQSCNNVDTGAGAAGGTTFPGPRPGVPTTTSTCPFQCSLAIGQGGPPCGSQTANLAYAALQTCAGCSGPQGAVDCEAQCPSFCSDGPLESTCSSCLMTNCTQALTNCFDN
jgi:hypothetical protein